MPTGTSVQQWQLLGSVTGELLSFTLATNATVLGYTNELLGRWSLRVEVLNVALGNPYVEVAWGNLYAGGVIYAPQFSPFLAVSNYQVNVNWRTPGISWELDWQTVAGITSVQGPPGPAGPAGDEFFVSDTRVVVAANQALAVDTYYEISASGLNLTLPGVLASLGHAIWIWGYSSNSPLILTAASGEVTTGPAGNAQSNSYTLASGGTGGTFLLCLPFVNQFGKFWFVARLTTSN